MICISQKNCKSKKKKKQKQTNKKTKKQKTPTEVPRMFETQKSGNKTSSREITLNITFRTLASPSATFDIFLNNCQVL